MNIKKRARALRVFKRYLPYYALLLPPLVYLFIFKYMPMWGLQIAFRDFKSNVPMLETEWRGLDYFRQFFSSSIFWQLIKNTVAIALYSLLAGFPVPILLAVCLNECRFVRFKKSVQMITYMPYFISTVVLVAMIIQFTELETGIINIWLRFFGLKPVAFMSKTEYFRHIYVWTGVWQTAGYNAIIYLAALSGVSQELHDAARVDGCNKWRRVWHVDLPGITPTIVILLTLNLGSLISVGFEKIYLMQNSFNKSISEVLSTYIYQVGVVNANYSFSTAAGMFNMVIAFMLVVIGNYAARPLSETSLWYLGAGAG
jgi:putative aldouronate transport system permease protein